MNSFNSLNAGLPSTQGIFTGQPTLPPLSIPLDFDSSLIAHYPFNGDVLDYATGVPVSNIFTTNLKLTTDSKLNGSTSLTQINTSEQPFFRFPNQLTNNNKYTISFWINLYQYGGVTHYLYNGPNMTITYVNGNGYDNLFCYLGPTGTATESGSISLSQWAHIALTVDTSNNNTGTIYLNNVATTTNTFTPFNFTDLSNVRVFLYNPISGIPMSYMVDFRYYNRLLSATEITQLYNFRNSYFSVFPNISIPLDADSGLQLHYPFNGDINNYASGTYGISDASFIMLDTNLIKSSQYVLGGTSLYNDGSLNGLSVKTFNINNTSGYTYSFWIYPTQSITNSSNIISFDLSSNVFQVYISTNTLVVKVTENGTPSTLTTTSNNISNNTWTHVSITMTSASSLVVYVNGNVDSSASSVPFVSNTELKSANIMYQMYGYIDDFRYYNRVLTETEIKQLYRYNTATFSLNMDPSMCLYYVFDVSASAVANYAQNIYGSLDASYASGARVSNSIYQVGSGSLDLSSGNATKPYVNIYTTSPISQTTFPTVNGLSFSIWFKTTVFNTAGTIFQFGRSNNPIYNAIVAKFNTSNSLSFYVDNTSSLNTLQNLTNNVNNTQWHHLVWTLTYAGSGSNTSTWKIYLDNVNISTFTSSCYYPPSGQSRSCTIGVNPALTTNFYHYGFIDDFRVYNRILNATEVSSLYTYTGLASSNSSVVAWYPPTKYRGFLGKLSYNYYYIDNSLNITSASTNTTYNNVIIPNQYSTTGLTYFLNAQFSSFIDSSYSTTQT